MKQTKNVREAYIPTILPIKELEKHSYYPKLWANRPKPFEGELLSSWITRTAMANLTNLTTLIYNVVEGHPFYLDLDLNWNLDLMQLLLEKTGVPEAKLREMTLLDVKKSINVISKNNSASSKMFKMLWITKWRTRSKNGLRYCPLCLKTDKIPFYRKDWRLGYMTVCLTHNCFLENKCPVCNSPLAPYRLKWDSNLIKCYKCGADLTETSIISIPASDPILKATKTFLLNPNNEIIHKVLSLARFIANYCTLSDPIFNNHPLTKDEKLINFWRKNSKKTIKLALFSNIQVSFLLIGTAIRLIQNEHLLDEFLKSFYTSRELFWTNKPFFCPEKGCNFTESDYSRMQIHIRRHRDERPFVCDICKKEFYTNYTLKKHKKIHARPHPFACPVQNCGQSFRYEKRLAQHLITVYNIKPYKCKYCDKPFTEKGDLKIHLRIHTREKPYECEYCGKKFAQKSALIVHLRVHTGEKPYKCKICGKSFTQSHALTEHMRIHTGETPYICPTCGKGYKRKHHLESHLRTHTGEKPFMCDICGKAFSEKGNLTKHKVIHTGERPFVCDICGKSFKYRTNLISHKKNYILEKHPLVE